MFPLSFFDQQHNNPFVYVQTSDSWYIELLEIELFDHLTVCKQMTDV